MYLQMKHLTQLLALATTGMILAFVFPARAGEKIITSESKSQSDPSKDSRFGENILKSRPKIDEPAFDPGLLGTPMLPSLGPLNRKEKQRLKDESAERRNWLLLEPG